MDNKSILRLGEMIIDPKQIFWRRQHIFAFIPYVQLLKGRKIHQTQISSLQPREVQHHTKTQSVVSCLISHQQSTYFGANSTTVYIQQSGKQTGGLGQLAVHIFPRKHGDFKKHQQLYDLLDKYPSELTKYYNQKIASYGNAFVGKILEGINQQRLKYEEFLNTAYKDEQSF